LIQLLLDSPLLLLFVVAAIGYPLGRIKIGGAAWGSTAVLFVSNLRVAGHRLRELYLPQAFGAVVTRLRRDDIEFVPHGDTVLELGDRVRVVTKRENMNAVNAFFGDSYRALSEIDVLTFSFGLALGLLVGTVPIPLPGGIVVKLGLADGPLIVALILGAVGRTGAIGSSVIRQPKRKLGMKEIFEI
jgi:uncharacterized transporter YbjL